MPPLAAVPAPGRAARHRGAHLALAAAEPAVRFSSLSLVRDAPCRARRGIRRHLPFALFVIGAWAASSSRWRARDIVALPAGQTTVILAMDVSRSMCSTDIPPNRAPSRPRRPRASFIERPAADHADRDRRLRRLRRDRPVPDDRPGGPARRRSSSLTTGRRTAIGSAILKSLDAIAEIDPSVAPSRPSDDAARRRRPTARPERRLRPGDHRPADRRRQQRRAGPGRCRRSRPRLAASGSTRSASAPPIPAAGNRQCGQQFIGREPPDNGGLRRVRRRFGGGGGGFRRAIDEDTLTAIADATGGTYYPAESADELNTVFQQLPTSLIVKHEVMEISVAFAAVGALLVALAVLLGQAWRPLP